MSQRGYTLVELLLASMMMLLVVAAIYTVFTSNQKAMIVQDEVNEIQTNARVGLELVANDLRQASAFLSAGVSTVAIQANYDSDATLESVKYAVLTSVLQRTYTNPTAAATTMDMDVNVVNLSFTYYNYNDTALSTPVAAAYLTSIRRVLISFAVYSPKGVADLQGNRRVRTLKTSVTTRNMWLTSY